MRRALVNGQVMTDQGLRRGLAVVLEDGRILGFASEDEISPETQRCDLGGNLLLPGFIDLQVNGGGGVLFNDRPTPQAIEAIGAAHRRFGTTGFLPTLISDGPGAVRTALAATREAMEMGVPGVLGAHIEGPHLNTDRRGIHDASNLRGLAQGDLEVLTSLGVGRTVVTLAPEMVAPEAIAQLARAGVIVSAGHTNASYTVVIEAMNRGLTGFTHLFNGMAPMTGREPGPVGAALSDPRAFCGIIVDGRHVDPVVLRLALACQSHDRFCLVTDAMPCVGGTGDSFILQGKLISVRDGACFDAKGGLAGSNLDMASAVRNAVGLLGLDLADAARMASANPAAFLGLGGELGHIAPGYRADLVLLDEDLRVRETWIGGVASAMTGARGD